MRVKSPHQETNIAFKADKAVPMLVRDTKCQLEGEINSRDPL
jgi:hypothetical protein